MSSSAVGTEMTERAKGQLYIAFEKITSQLWLEDDRKSCINVIETGTIFGRKTFVQTWQQ